MHPAGQPPKQKPARRKRKINDDYGIYYNYTCDSDSSQTTPSQKNLASQQLAASQSQSQVRAAAWVSHSPLVSASLQDQMLGLAAQKQEESEMEKRGYLNQEEPDLHATPIGRINADNLLV